MTRFRIDPHDEQGSTLLLALIFVVVLGLIIGVLTGLAGTNLTDTVQLQGQRGIEYAASSVVEAEIQALRYLTTGNNGGNAQSTAQYCVPFPAPTAPSTTSPGMSITEDRTVYSSVTAACSAFPGTRLVSVKVQNGSMTITANSANTFSSADVGQIVVAFGVPAGATIVSVQSDTSATMSVAAGSTACPSATPCTQSVTIQTPVGQRIVLIQGCLNVNSGMNCTGSPVVKAVVRYFDLGSDGKSHIGTGVTVQSWVVQGANS